MNPISLSNLLDTVTTYQPEVQSLIPGLLPQGLTLLLGQPRIGKSWLALHLALSIASGDLALGQLPTTHTDVLYLGLQDTPQRMCIRTRKLLGPRPVPDNLTWTNQLTFKPSLSTTDTDQLATLDLWLTEHPQTRLLVIDSLDRLLVPSSGISTQTTTQQELALMQQLKTLADHHHIAILLVSQYATTKTNHHPFHELSHIPALAIADTILLIKRNRGQADATLLFTSADQPDQELALHLPTDTMSWTLLGPANDYRLSQERQDILALLQEHRDGPLSPKQIATLLHKDVRAVTKLLFDMSHATQIRLIGRGQYMTIQTYIPPTNTELEFLSFTTLEPELPSTSNNGNNSNDGNQPCANNGNNSNDSNQPFIPIDLEQFFRTHYISPFNLVDKDNIE